MSWELKTHLLTLLFIETLKLLSRLSLSKTLRRRRRGAHVGAGPVDARSDVARDAGETVVLPYAIQANWTFWVCHTKWVKKGGV